MVVVDGPISLPIQPKVWETGGDVNNQVLDWEGGGAEDLRAHDTVGSRLDQQKLQQTGETNETNETYDVQTKGATSQQAEGSAESLKQRGGQPALQQGGGLVEGSKAGAQAEGSTAAGGAKPFVGEGGAESLKQGGGPPELYHYYFYGEPHDLEELHDDANMFELHKACDGQTQWSNYHLRHMDYSDARSKFGRVKYSFNEAKRQYDNFVATGHPWRNYQLCEEDIAKGYDPCERPNEVLYEGDMATWQEAGVTVGAEGKPTKFASPSTALGMRGVVIRKQDGPIDLGLLEGPKKEVRMGDGRTRPHFTKRTNRATEGIPPFRNTMYSGKRTVKGQDLKEAVIATTVFEMDRHNWANEKATRAQ